MTERQKSRRSDDATLARQASQTPLADAVTLAAAASGLVMGTLATTTAADQPAVTPTAAEPDAPGPHHAHMPATSPATGGPADPDPAPPASLAAPPVAAVAQAPEPIPLDPTPPMPLPEPMQAQLVADLSQQIADTVIKAVSQAPAALSPTQLGETLAQDIVASAQKIVAQIDVGPLVASGPALADHAILTHAADLAQTITATATETLEPVLEKVVDLPADLGDTIAQTVADATADLPVVADLQSSLDQAIAHDAGALLAEIPTALLGNDGPDDAGGLLGELFYPDGGAETLAIPALSDTATTLVSDIGAATTGLLATSYTDSAGEHHAGGLNALSLL